MNASLGVLKVVRARMRLADERAAFLCHRRVLLERKRINWRFFSQQDAGMLAFVERRIRLCDFQDYLLGGPPLHRKGGFDPNQPRVPAGNSDGGRWTDGDGTADSILKPISTGVLGIAEVLVDSLGIKPTTDYLDDETDFIQDNLQLIASKKIVTIDYSRALTGISTIDDTTKALSETLSQSMGAVDFIPQMLPNVYGSAVHLDFAGRVRASGLRGISSRDVEQSFLDGDVTGYGGPDSIRTDVILRSDSGDIIAIYDVKTGGAKLTPARIKKIREHTGVGLSVPIIELQVNRGASIKGRTLREEHIGSVIAKIWI
jgi:hypothetical protein